MPEMPSGSGNGLDAKASREDPTDHSLLRRLRQGNQEAATQLYERYAKRVRALAKSRCSTELERRLEADDIVQSVFRRFFQHAAAGEYDVPAGEELWKLFLVMALNKIRAAELYHRAGKRDIRRTVSEPLADSNVAAPGGRLSDSYLGLALHEALELLPPMHRKVVQLRMEGYEVAEIAAHIGRSLRTAERLLQEARTRLNASLAGPD